VVASLDAIEDRFCGNSLSWIGPILLVTYDHFFAQPAFSRALVHPRTSFQGKHSSILFLWKSTVTHMQPDLSTTPTPASDAALVTKTAIRAADKLRINNKVLAGVIGVSEATVSRMRNGKHTLEAGSKPFQLAVLLVRLYRSLDALIGGDDVAARAWLTNTNTALGAAPVELISSVSGLMNVIQYLDARRAVV
jgi:Protein of unknown function (DUF2384)